MRKLRPREAKHHGWVDLVELNGGARFQAQGSCVASQKHDLERFPVMTVIIAIITVTIMPLEISLQPAKVCHEAGWLVITDAGAPERFCRGCLMVVSLIIASPGDPMLAK